MHIPDGFLSTPVWLTLDVASVPAVGLLARRAHLNVEDTRVPLLGVLGAFVFAAQTINFPVGLGTSGHLIGGTLLACTVGPAAASIVMTAILAIQAFLFQDGGVLALGANVMSMAVAGVVAGYLPYHFFGSGRLRTASLFAGGVLSVLASACAALGFLYLSGIRVPPALVGVPFVVFAVNAVAEGLITVAVVASLERMNPRWIRTPSGTATPVRVLGFAAVLLAGCGFLFASAQPDGLERLGISSRAAEVIPAPLAGILGIAVAYAVCMVAMRVVAGLRRS